MGPRQWYDAQVVLWLVLLVACVTQAAKVVRRRQSYSKNRRRVIVIFLAAASVIVIVYGSDEPYQLGEPVMLHKMPTVHRTWKNIHKFPVPKVEWERLGFQVRDVDDKAMLEDVRNAGLEEIYRLLPNAASRADLWRLVVVHTFGGWYADADVFPRPGIAVLGKTRDLVMLNEACGFSSVSRFKTYVGLSSIMHAPQYKNSIFAAPQGWSGLAKTISMVRERVNANSDTQRWSQQVLMDITGPGVLTDAIEDLLFLDDKATVLPCSRQKDLYHHASMGSWRGGGSSIALQAEESGSSSEHLN